MFKYLKQGQHKIDVKIPVTVLIERNLPIWVQVGKEDGESRIGVIIHYTVKYKDRFVSMDFDTIEEKRILKGMSVHAQECSLLEVGELLIQMLEMYGHTDKKHLEKVAKEVEGLVDVMLRGNDIEIPVELAR